MPLGTREESAFAYKVVDLGDVCYGSAAALSRDSTVRSAIGGEADEKSARTPDSKSQQSATSSRTGKVGTRCVRALRRLLKQPLTLLV